MRFFVGSFFGLQGRGGFFDLAVEFFAGFAELVEALTEASGEFGKAFRAEENEDDEQDQEDFRPTRGAESKDGAHGFNATCVAGRVQPRMFTTGGGGFGIA